MAVATDTLGRVMLLDVASMAVVRLWKVCFCAASASNSPLVPAPDFLASDLVNDVAWTRDLPTALPRYG